MATFGAERVIWEKKYRERCLHRAGHYNSIHNTWQVFVQAGTADMWKLEKVVKAGGNVNWHNPKRSDRTALMQAASLGQLTPLKYLMANGARLDERDRNGATAVMLCVQKGEMACLTTLIDNGADVNIQDNNGTTALMMACDADNIDVAKVLLMNGADQTLTDNDGNWPFIKACAEAKAENIKLLIKFGAPIYQQHRDGFTGLQLASNCGHREIVQLIHRSVEELERRAQEQEELEELALG